MPRSTRQLEGSYPQRPTWSLTTVAIGSNPKALSPMQASPSVSFRHSVTLLRLQGIHHSSSGDETSVSRPPSQPVLQPPPRVLTLPHPHSADNVARGLLPSGAHSITHLVTMGLNPQAPPPPPMPASPSVSLPHSFTLPWLQGLHLTTET